MIDKKRVKIPCEIYSRVVGFYRPVGQWNPGKKSEWRDRVTYGMPKSMMKNKAIK